MAPPSNDDDGDSGGRSPFAGGFFGGGGGSGGDSDSSGGSDDDDGGSSDSGGSDDSPSSSSSTVSNPAFRGGGSNTGSTGDDADTDSGGSSSGGPPSGDVRRGTAPDPTDNDSGGDGGTGLDDPIPDSDPPEPDRDASDTPDGTDAPVETPAGNPPDPERGVDGSRETEGPTIPDAERERLRQEIASDVPGLSPSEIEGQLDVEETDDGVRVGLTEFGEDLAQLSAGEAALEEETGRDVELSDVQVSPQFGGVQFTPDAQKEIVASQTGVPKEDIKELEETGGGRVRPKLTKEAKKRRAAEDASQQFNRDVPQSDIELTDDGYRLTGQTREDLTSSRA